MYIYFLYILSAVLHFQSPEKSSAEKNPIIPIYNIATSVEQGALTLEMDLGIEPQLFPCCSWAEVDRSVCALTASLADYEGTNISTEFSCLA